MPAHDIYHDTVKNALIKDGWTITHDPLTLELGSTRLFVDLGAEQVIGAEKGLHKIAVEIKTFRGASEMKDLEQAIGQYVLYRIFLRRVEPDRELYLAVPQDVVEEVFSEEYGRGFLQDEHGKLFGFDIESEEVVAWLS
jgi:hypothetical protein